MKKIPSFYKKSCEVICNHKLFSSFICGVIFATPYLWEWLFPFLFLSLFGLFYLLNHEKSKDKFFQKDFFVFLAFFFGIFINVYTLFFKLYPFEGFDFTKAQGITIVIVGWILSSLIHSAIGAFILSFSKHFKNSPIIYAAISGSLWVIYEWSMSLGFLAFPWVNISIGLIKFLPFLQTASLFGNGFITFITVFSLVLLVRFSLNRSKKILLNFAITVLSANLLIGTVFYFIPEKTEKELNALIVQGNIEMGEKWNSNNFLNVLTTHEKLIRDSLSENTNKKYDVVLMAETVFPATYTQNGLIYQTVSAIAKDFNVTVIFGLLIKDENDMKHNAIMAIYPDGTVSDYYTKQKLVPFGEKMPSLSFLSSVIPSLNTLEGTSKYYEGTESKVIISHNGTKYGPLVCYDSVFPNLNRKNVQKGAEIIAVSTNDSWYKDGAAVSHHKKHSVLRAIETGRYILRSANTGISCVIDSKGNIICQSDVLCEAVLSEKAYTINKDTLYNILGNTSLYLSFAFTVLIFGFTIIKKARIFAVKS